MNNLEHKLESLRAGVGDMRHGLPGDDGHCTRLRLTDEEREAILLAVEHGENASSLGPLRPIWTLTLRRLLERTK
jgi:hypothetical protein